MTYTDPIATLKGILDGITITPESLPSISKVVSVEWLDESNRGGPNGEITPQYTLALVSSPEEALDANGAVKEGRMLIQIDIWCQTYGPTENDYNLKIKMFKALQSIILANRSEPSSTIKYMEIKNFVDRDELARENKPPLRRRIVFVECHYLV